MKKYNYNNNNNYNIPNKKTMDINYNIPNKKTVIFCRVSTLGQTTPGTVSFQVQENKGRVCYNIFKLKVMCVIKIVESVYQGNASTIYSIINSHMYIFL